MIKLFFLIFMFFQIIEESLGKNLNKFYNTVAIGINGNYLKNNIKNTLLTNNKSDDSFNFKDKKIYSNLIFSIDNNFLYKNIYYAFGTEHEIYFAQKNQSYAQYNQGANIRKITCDLHKKYSHGLFFKLGKKINEKIIVYGIFKTKINFANIRLIDKVNLGTSVIPIFRQNFDANKNINYISNGLGFGFSYKLQENWLISMDYLYNLPNKIKITHSNTETPTVTHSIVNNRNVDLKIKSSHALGVKLHYAF